MVPPSLIYYPIIYTQSRRCIAPCWVSHHLWVTKCKCTRINILYYIEFKPTRLSSYQGQTLFPQSRSAGPVLVFKKPGYSWPWTADWGEADRTDLETVTGRHLKRRAAGGCEGNKAQAHDCWTRVTVTLRISYPTNLSLVNLKLQSTISSAVV